MNLRELAQQASTDIPDELEPIDEGRAFFNGKTFADGTRAFYLRSSKGVVAYTLPEPVARYFAAVTPSYVLALLDSLTAANARAERAEGELAEVRNCYQHSMSNYQQWQAELRSAIAERNRLASLHQEIAEAVKAACKQAALETADHTYEAHVGRVSQSIAKKIDKVKVKAIMARITGSNQPDHRRVLAAIEEAK